MFAAAQHPFKCLTSSRSLNREGKYNQYRSDMHSPRTWILKKTMTPKKFCASVLLVVILLITLLKIWKHLPCYFTPKIWISCACLFTILCFYSRNSFQNNLDYYSQTLSPVVLPQKLMSPMYCSCWDHTPCSSAVCVNPWQIIFYDLKWLWLFMIYVLRIFSSIETKVKICDTGKNK